MAVKIPIYIIDSSRKDGIEKLIQENDNLGFEKNKISKDDLLPRYALVDFMFDEKEFYGYWKDPGRDDETKTVDIVLYIGCTSFRTPYSKEIEQILLNLLDRR